MPTDQPSANLDSSRYDYAINSIRDLRPKLPSNLVFDLGPGDGRLRSLEQFNIRWRGFDLTAWRDVARWDLSDPCPVAEKAGAVLLLDVIEHCVNPGLALRNISAAMEIDGTLILTTPNPRWSGGRIHMLFRGLLSGFTPLDLSQNHHVLPIWPHVLEKLLSDVGMTIQEYVTLDGRATLFGRPGKMPLLARCPLNAVLMVIEKLDYAARGMSYGIIAKKVRK